jgi:hypothetical protein
MRYLKIYAAYASLLFVISACAPLETNSLSTTQNTDCVGQIEPVGPGLKPVTNVPLLESAIGKDLDGKLCSGKVFEVTAPVKVYRVWSVDKAYTAYGGWWSFNQPTGTRASYQVQNNICPEWSALDIEHACFLKVGAQIVVGTGQSAKCESEILKKTAVNQVYVPNDTRKDILLVDNCSDPKPWPQ